MKRALSILVIFLVTLGAFAQETSFEQINTDFLTFFQGLSDSLPYNATIGLNWSDAYIGQFFALPPHFGVGATIGVTTIPIAAIAPLLADLGLNVDDLPAQLKFLKQYGIPIPAYTIDARIGGLLLPFDVGVKLGYLTPKVLQEIDPSIDLDLNYILAGADVRLALVQENILLPNISIGAGYYLMQGGITVPHITDDLTLTSFSFPDGSTHTLGFSGPDLNFNWATNVIDLKAQISKGLLLITPYAGAGASLAVSTVSGGIQSQMIVDGYPVTQDQMDLINAVTGGNIDIVNPGFALQVMGKGGWAFRVFAGASLNILIIKLDVGASYNITNGAYGVTVNARVQL